MMPIIPKNIPIIAPKIEPTCPIFVPPFRLTASEGKIKSNTVITIVITAVMSRNCVLKLIASVAFANNNANHTKDGPGRTGRIQPTTPTMAAINAKRNSNISTVSITSRYKIY